MSTVKIIRDMFGLVLFIATAWALCIGIPALVYWVFGGGL